MALCLGGLDAMNISVSTLGSTVTLSGEVVASGDLLIAKASQAVYWACPASETGSCRSRDRQTFDLVSRAYPEAKWIV